MATSRRHSIVSQTRLLARSGVRVADVVWKRYLHRTPRYVPFIIMFITDRCNLHCKMCGVCEHDPLLVSAPELSTEEWRGVLRSAKKLGATLASMSGGEPLLRPDVFDIIRYARDLGMAVHVCSNGMLVDREVVARFVESRVNTISISIESPVKEIHELLRGKGSFEPAVQSVRLLREFAPSIQVGINYLITTANFRNMSAMIPFAEALGAHQLKFAPIHTNLLHRRKRIESYGSLIFGEEDLEDLDREVRELMRAAAHSKIQTTSTMFLSGISRLYSKPKKFTCFAGYATCSINPNGTVAPCCDIDTTLSVRDRPLDAIWRSKEFQELRHNVHQCNRSCWDTTNAEMSLRLQLRSLVRDIAQTWRDVAFYFSDDRK